MYDCYNIVRIRRRKKCNKKKHLLVHGFGYIVNYRIGFWESWSHHPTKIIDMKIDKKLLKLNVDHNIFVVYKGVMSSGNNGSLGRKRLKL